MGVFDEQNNDGVTTPVVDENAAPVVNDIWAEKLKMIVRDDGTPRYNSVEAALDAITHKDNHIAQLEAEAKVLADKAREAETLKQTLERLGNKMNEEKPNIRPDASGGLSEEAAKELVQNILKGERQTEAAVNNIKQVQNSLVSKFGSEKAAQEAVIAKAKELGVSTEKLKQDSATSPAYVLALFGNSKPSPVPNVGSMNLSTPQPTDNEVKRPDKSVLSGRGATDRNQTDLMKQIRESIHKKHGVTV